MAISTPALGSLFKLSRENTVRVECAAPSPLSRLNTDEMGGGGGGNRKSSPINRCSPLSLTHKHVPTCGVLMRHPEL